MKKMIVVLSSLMAGCASQYQAASQNYRPKNNNASVEIKGELLRKVGVFEADNRVNITFNGATQIDLKLDKSFFGEGAGKPYNDQTTSASCSGRKVSKYNVEIRCMVFIDNERTVTLTF